MGPKVKLNQYIEQVSQRPFEWGVHDCLIFSNEAFKAYWGRGYCDDWLSEYMTDNRVMRASELRKHFGFSSISAALNARLKACVPTKYGALVTTEKSQRWVTGVALGVSVGSRCLFLSKQGMIAINSVDTNGAWVPNEA